MPPAHTHAFMQVSWPKHIRTVWSWGLGASARQGASVGRGPSSWRSAISSVRPWTCPSMPTGPQHRRTPQISTPSPPNLDSRPNMCGEGLGERGAKPPSKGEAPKVLQGQLLKRFGSCLVAACKFGIRGWHQACTWSTHVPRWCWKGLVRF